MSYAPLGGYCVLFHRKRSLGCATANDDSRIALCSVGMNSVVCKSNNRSRAVAATLTDTNGIAAYGNGRVVDYNVRGILNVKTVLRLNGTTVDLDTGYVYNLKKTVHGIVNSTVNDSKILIATGVRLDSSDCTVATGKGTTLKGYVGYVTSSCGATEVNASCLGNISCIEVYVSDSKATVSKGCALAIDGDSTVEGMTCTVNNKIEVGRSNESEITTYVCCKGNNNAAINYCSKSILKAEVVCIADISNNVTACYEIVAIRINIAVDYINLDALGNRSRKLFAPVVSICSDFKACSIGDTTNSDVSYATLGGYCILFHGKRSLGCATANDDSRIALCSVGMNSVVCKSNNRSRAVAATLTDTNGIAAYGNGRVVDYNVRGILNVKTVLRLNGTTVDLDTGYVYNLKKTVHGIVNSTVNDSKILIATGVRLDSSDCTVATGEGTILKGYVGNVTGSIRATEVNASCLGNISCIEVYISDSKATVSKGCALAVNGNSTVKGVIVTINNEVEI